MLTLVELSKNRSNGRERLRLERLEILYYQCFSLYTVMTCIWIIITTGVLSDNDQKSAHHLLKCTFIYTVYVPFKSALESCRH